MQSSYGETSGFKAVTAEELMLVNGGKDSGGHNSVHIGYSGVSFPYGNGRITVSGDLQAMSISATYSVSK